jgi:hypothetical protein
MAEIQAPFPQNRNPRVMSGSIGAYREKSLDKFPIYDKVGLKMLEWCYQSDDNLKAYSMKLSNIFKPLTKECVMIAFMLGLIAGMLFGYISYGTYIWIRG